MASSYVATANRALKLGDQTKCIACFAAGYGWLSEFLTDNPKPGHSFPTLELDL